MLIIFLYLDSLNYKSSKKAVLLSTFIPGGGQFYNGKTLKGSIISLTDISSFSLFLYNAYKYNTTKQENYYWSSIGYFITFFAVKMFSIADAYIDSKMINAKRSQEKIENVIKVPIY
jgi:TM2 domain-containing membrane protein YozV